MSFGGMAISIEVFQEIKKNLPEGSTILELGTGDSTKELLEYYKVISIEFDPKYIGYAKGAEYIYAPIKSYGNYKWFDREIISKKLTKPYDLILIDSPTGVIGRYGFWHNKDLFDLSKILIIDDMHREEEFNLFKQLTMYLKRPAQVNVGTNTLFGIIK